MSRRSLATGSEVDGKYRLVRHIGSGGMGEVFEAEDRSLGRRVALKLLPESAQGEPLARERLLREARAAARIRHPRIVQVYEVGSDGESDYVAMELLEGEDLDARLRREGPLQLAFVERLALSLADALIAMHEAGIVHRDLKPKNIFLSREGREIDVLKVLDFGIAKSSRLLDDTITATGEVFGTPQYMAPECLRGAKHADARSDIWSAGVVLYEVLTARKPFEAQSVAELAVKLELEAPPPLESLRPDTPAGLLAAVRRAMARDPAARFPDARAFYAALSGQGLDIATSDTRPLPSNVTANGSGPAGTTPPGRARRRGVSVVVTLAALLLGVVGLRSLLEARSAADAASGALPTRDGHARQTVPGETREPVPALPIVSTPPLSSRPDAGLPRAKPSPRVLRVLASAAPRAVAPKAQPTDAAVADEAPEAPPGQPVVGTPAKSSRAGDLKRSEF